jgi:hypothetical protein
VSFRSPATIIDAIDFFKQASRDYDDPEIPVDQRGVSFILKLQTSGGNAEGDDPFAPASSAPPDVPVIPTFTARNISLYDALRLVCEVTGMKLNLKHGLVMLVPLNDPDTELLSQNYSVLPRFVECVSYTLAELQEQDKWQSQTPTVETQENEYKKFFARLGVQWPTGSSVTYFGSQLRVTNTQENLEHLEQILSELNVIPVLVQVDLQVVTFQKKDIEKLQLAGNMTKEALLRLWKAGKAKLTATASAEVNPAQEAIVKVTQEISYPSEFNVQMSYASSDGGMSFRKPIWVPEPQNFTMRETGIILQITPKVEENGTLITLNLKPQWVTLDQWISHGPKNLFLQPVFGVTSFESQVTIADGDTILLGNSSTTDGKWVNVGFLTAKKVRVQK